MCCTYNFKESIRRILLFTFPAPFAGMHGCGFPTAVSDAQYSVAECIEDAADTHVATTNVVVLLARPIEPPREIVAKKNGAQYSEDFEFRCRGCMRACQPHPQPRKHRRSSAVRTQTRMC